MKMSKRVPAAILSLIPMFIVSLAVGLYLIPEGAGFFVDLLRILTIVLVPVGVFLLILLVNTKRRNAFQFFWFWLIMLPVAIVFLAILSPEAVVVEDGTSRVEQAEPEETEPEETTPPETTPEEYMAACETIDYETLARNPEKYAGNKYTFSGEVVQVIEGWTGTSVRINITPTEIGSSVYYADTIYATLDPKENGDRILEDDILVIYGECTGLYSYTSVLGSEVYLPSIDVMYWDFVTEEEAPAAESVE